MRMNSLNDDCLTKVYSFTRHMEDAIRVSMISGALEEITRCTNITGVGLKSLRGSTTLQSLDLRLEAYKGRKKPGPITTLSFKAIQPLISSMLSGNKGVPPSLEIVNLRHQHDGHHGFSQLTEMGYDEPWNKIVKLLALTSAIVKCHRKLAAILLGESYVYDATLRKV
ncbi:hypothetical protein TrLO_g9088 [Triparma laevis f. longispina]|uniref:Uncharacterized protein n=1 Tax=Triparma laevis f. longispina TaxID=1714387 RepID=A0A9W7ALG7_9STRA|nr:hypothetical protein TrLO_g9088 [Triparma laevis f. longispina]